MKVTFITGAQLRIEDLPGGERGDFRSSLYDVCQYTFSGEGEYALDMHHIFSQYSPSIVVILTKSAPLEDMYS